MATMKFKGDTEEAAQRRLEAGQWIASLRKRPGVVVEDGPPRIHRQQEIRMTHVDVYHAEPGGPLMLRCRVPHAEYEAFLAKFSGDGHHPASPLGELEDHYWHLSEVYGRSGDEMHRLIWKSVALSIQRARCERGEAP